MKKFLFLLFLFPCLAYSAETQAVTGEFKGLHNSDASILINDNESQDLLNVDITDSGKGIKKRAGMALYQAFGYSTHPVTGAYYFRDVSGNDTVIGTNDQAIYKSVGNAAFSSFVTTDTADSYYDFSDSQGYLYRLNSSRNEFVRWDGTTKTYYPLAPKGDQGEALADRFVISGTAANPNRLNFSASGDFTSYATGSLETDPFTEDIGLPGQRIFAIKQACGGILSFTKNTMSGWQGTNQYDGIIQDISNTVGTIQPNTVITDLGLVFWQGQDGHFYSYDCNIVSKISQNLDVSNFSSGSPKQWTQTSASEWAAGTLTQVTTNTTVGDVLLSTWTQTDTATADFAAGSFSNTFVSSNRVYLSTNNTNVDNNDFESALGAEWTASAGMTRTSSECSMSPPSGSSMMAADSIFSSYGNILDINGVYLSTTNITPGTAGSFETKTIDTSTYVGRYIKLRIVSGSAVLTSSAFLCSGTSITLRSGTNALPCTKMLFDLVEGGRSTTYSGTFTSQAFNTGFSTAAWLSSGANWTTNSHAISMQTQASADASSWDTAVSWSTGSAPTSSFKQYIRYVVTLSTGGTTNGTALPYVDDVTFSARAATGTFISQTKNIGSNVTAFGNFAADDTSNGGTLAYFIRTATSEGGLSSASWISLTKDALITASTNPWIQVKSSFTITLATQTPTLSDFTINWNEGSLSRNFGVVDINHRLLWAVGEGGSSTPNATYIYDQRFGTWLKYSIPFQAAARVDSQVFFGSTTIGSLYQWPSGTSDAGSAITSYWKSKDFIGTDPFVEKDFISYSLISKTQSGSNLDVTYTINTSSSILTNYLLTDSNFSYRRINTNFPSGKYGTFINFKFGNDDADAAFELYGFKYDYNKRPWRVMQ